MDVLALGRAAAGHGWRKHAANALEAPLARLTPASREQAHALVGLAFFAISAAHLLRTIRRARQT